eukprot:TRINITY_DN15211_c2_g1_i1.p1 TRINITY_DN15211_c2_g1~~TRINITY_DN15211_c2_g1_i1.p1  ORF type:complete len:500 (+),score=52.38 TRINITY_DN15211_c2_g1_i1:25-1524(+)
MALCLSSNCTVDSMALALLGFALLRLSIAEQANETYCDLRQPTIPVHGDVVKHGHSMNFVHSSGCRYGVYDGAQMAQCLEGSWYVFMGGSVAQVWFIQLIHLLAPGQLQLLRDQVSACTYVGFLDVFIEDRRIVHKTLIHWSATPVQVTHAVRYRGIGYKSKLTRVTFFRSLFWDEVALPLEAVKQAHFWQKAPVSVVTGIGQWYLNAHRGECNKAFCRPFLRGMPEGRFKAIVRKNLLHGMHHLEEFCAPDGRAGLLGCTITQMSKCSYRKEAVFSWLHDVVNYTTSERRTSNLRYLDLSAFIGQFRESCVDGHPSPLMATLALEAFLGGICQNRTQIGGTEASFHGLSCTAPQAYWHCKNYHAMGYRYKWDCALAKGCSVTAGGSHGIQQLSSLPNFSAEISEAPTELKVWSSGESKHFQGLSGLSLLLLFAVAVLFTLLSYMTRRAVQQQRKVSGAGTCVDSLHPTDTDSRFLLVEGCAAFDGSSYEPAILSTTSA